MDPSIQSLSYIAKFPFQECRNIPEAIDGFQTVLTFYYYYEPFYQYHIENDEISNKP